VSKTVRNVTRKLKSVVLFNVVYEYLEKTDHAIETGPLTETLT